MRKKHCGIASLGILISLFTFLSCDNEYDLDKVDMTVNIGGSEFAVPGGNTDKWTLEQVLDLEKDGLIKSGTDGDYSLVKKGDDSDPSQVSIEDVTVDAPTIADIDIDLNYQSGAPQRLRAAADSMVIVIPDNKKTSFDMKNDHMPVELLTMSYLTVRNMDITLAITGPAKLSLRDLTITFPDYMDIEGVVNGKYKLPADAVTGSNGIYKKTLAVKGMRVSNFYDPRRRLLELTGDILASGKFWMSKADYNSAGAGILKRATVAIDMSDLLIETVTGKVNPKIDIKVSPVELTGIPSFLQDDQVRLDLDNPMILLQIVNDAPVDVNAIGKFVAKKNNKILKDTVYTENIPIKAASNNLICLSRTGISSLPGYTNVRVPELSALLERIPDLITFTIDAHSDTNKEFTIRLGHEYEVQPDYEVDAPLAFGENLEIVYNDTIDGWNSDLKDYEIKKMTLNADAYNSIPLDVTLTAVTVDVNGTVLNGIKTTVDRTIPAGSGDRDTNGVFQASETSIVITMEETVPGTFKKLDGIMIKANAVVNKGTDGMGSTVGKNLNENQYLQLTKIRLKVPGGVNIDLN